MPFDKIDIESITEERRKSVAKSIRAASGEELRKLGDEVFHDLDAPDLHLPTCVTAFAQNKSANRVRRTTDFEINRPPPVTF